VRTQSAEVAVVGSGIIGIATAYYLAVNHGIKDVLLIDAAQAMTFTSAQSGENYRNWWPQPTMVALTNRSIDLMETIARASDNQINMTRRGYVLATRNPNVDELVAQLRAGLGETAEDLLRFHDRAQSETYQQPARPHWENAPTGVDILQSQELIRRAFPSYDREIETVIHIRRGGDISGQQLGMFMLESIRGQSPKRLIGNVESISRSDRYKIEVATQEGTCSVSADKIVNAAGPFADKIANMLGVELPIHNTFQQKIAFDDTRCAIPRNMPFSIDLDEQTLDWSGDEREMLAADSALEWLTRAISGSIHCRPDGGDHGSWIKLGWAYNDTRQAATRQLPLNEIFPEIVLRGAARLNPALKAYYDSLPRNRHHYGGWYTMTDENWPLIGKMGPDGAYMNCAMSGFGTMAACAAGELCAAWVAEATLPSYASDMSLERYQNAGLMRRLIESNKGVL